MRIDILGVGFDGFSLDEAVTRALGIIDDNKKAYIVTPNPEIVWMARRDETLRDTLNGAGIVLPDGVGITIAARILGSPLPGGRVPGVDFITALLAKMAATGARVFLLGAKPGVAIEAGFKLAEMHNGLVISGTADGYFKDDMPVIEKINSSGSDLLLVCLGAPKQELWMAKNSDRIRVPLSIGLGGALDIFSGKAKRAPMFFQKLGLEWFYRLVREPYRIKRMIKLPLFLFAVIWKRVRGKRGG